jgi:hypothetical protein
MKFTSEKPLTQQQVSWIRDMLYNKPFALEVEFDKLPVGWWEILTFREFESESGQGLPMTHGCHSYGSVGSYLFLHDIRDFNAFSEKYSKYIRSFTPFTIVYS